MGQTGAEDGNDDRENFERIVIVKTADGHGKGRTECAGRRASTISQYG